MNLLQINVTANWGSHGKIAEAIGQLAMDEGWQSLIAYGRGNPASQSQLLRIGNNMDMRIHGVATRLFDLHGRMSHHVTNKFIKNVSEYNPDIIHLHNIHGYYLNYSLLFDWLKSIDKPVIWTLHDCWPWTGHCAYYTYSECDKWKTGCGNCEGLSNYPASFKDGSKSNYELKKKSFNGLSNLTLVPVSNWLNHDIQNSFLKNYNSQVIHNGIDVNLFRPVSAESSVKRQYGLQDKSILLGVASVWEQRKGLEEFIKLRHLLPYDYHIILVGLTERQIKELPSGMTGINRTNNIEELVALYSAADIFLNPTLEDNFPTTNLEALACGTPVITYNTGGSPEAVDADTGIVVDYKDINGFAECIRKVKEGSLFSKELCRNRAVAFFDKDKAFKKYIDLYKTVLN